MKRSFLFALLIFATVFGISLPFSKTSAQSGQFSPSGDIRGANRAIADQAGFPKGAKPKPADAVAALPCGTSTPITLGSTASGSLSVADCTMTDGTYIDLYSFSGYSGQPIYVTLSSSAFDSYLYLYDSTGNSLFENDDSNNSNDARIPVDAGVIVLPSTGTFYIGVNSWALATGNYSVTLNTETNCAATAVNPPETVSSSLTSGDCKVNGGGLVYYTKMYSFSGTSGRKVAIEMSSTAFDSYLILHTPSGTGTLENDNGGGSSNARIPSPDIYFTLPETGTYIIEATTFDPNVIGAFTLNTLLEPTNCTYSISPTSVSSVLAAGASNTLSVTPSNSLCSWAATSNTSWLTVSSGATGIGNGTVGYTVAANITPARTGTLTVAGQTFTVNQLNGCAYSLTPTSVSSVAAAGATGTFTVSSGTGCTWTSSSNATWVTVTSGSSGTSNGTVGYSAAANTGPARTGTITAGGQTFTINQLTGCTYSLSPSSPQSAAAAGGSLSVTVTPGNSACAWTAASNAAWITVSSGASGTGTGSVGITVAANTGTSRTGTLTIAGQTYTVNQAAAPSTKPVMDFDGDGKTDVGIWRQTGASGGAEYWYLKSGGSAGAYGAFGFGQSTDLSVPADYTGDGKTDLAFFRPSNGYWYVLRSDDFSFYAFPFGAGTDIPAPADFDGDGKADPAVYRASAGTWFVLRSSNGGVDSIPFGISADKPIPGDYDGDGKADAAVWRQNGTFGAEWWILGSTAGPRGYGFGESTDKAVPADYTGDGKTDLAFFRPGNGQWYVLRSNDFSFYAFPFGSSTDTPSPGDYDGDGKADAAVFRAGQWYILRSGNGGVDAVPFGVSTDKPIVTVILP